VHVLVLTIEWCYKVLKRASDLDKSFITNQAMNKRGNVRVT